MFEAKVKQTQFSYKLQCKNFQKFASSIKTKGTLFFANGTMYF